MFSFFFFFLTLGLWLSIAFWRKKGLSVVRINFLLVASCIFWVKLESQDILWKRKKFMPPQLLNERYGTTVVCWKGIYKGYYQCLKCSLQEGFHRICIMETQHINPVSKTYPKPPPLAKFYAPVPNQNPKSTELQTVASNQQAFPWKPSSPRLKNTKPYCWCIYIINRTSLSVAQLKINK